MNRLPRADLATLDAVKVRDYLLNSRHPQNGGNAAFFGRFGFSMPEWRELSRALQHHPVKNEVVAHEQSAYGTKYVVKCALDTPDGRDPCITTIWIIEGSASPRLVTAYP